ncbi:hypothetical protein HNQ86_001486 [Oleiagrimonas soli]|uniref:LysR family transcriptional regulator n=1 Tax=Oleiagrimonas soli TaxID=1543381 RepID=A0A841KNB3_9GAMM|nr:hypothetical protein [Oleiagrimonas soli]
MSDSPVHQLWLPGADRECPVRCLVDFLAASMADE